MTTLMIALSCTGITRAELACEQAVSQITSCCPGVDPRLLPCVESEGGCTSGEASPVVNEAASECILDRDCDALRTSGKCDAIREYSLVPHANKTREKLAARVCQ